LPDNPVNKYNNRDDLLTITMLTVENNWALCTKWAEACRGWCRWSCLRYLWGED